MEINEKRLYKRATGKNCDDDYKKYKVQYENKENYELERRWQQLNYDIKISTYAERRALKSLMNERGMDYLGKQICCCDCEYFESNHKNALGHYSNYGYCKKGQGHRVYEPGEEICSSFVKKR